MYLFQNHFSSSESTMQGYVHQMEQLRQDLANCEDRERNLEGTVTELRAELEKRKLKLKKQTSITLTDKV